VKTRILAAAVALATCATARAEDWRLSVTPYVWATDVGIDVAVRDRQLVDATIPFEDLLGDLESAALIRAEAMRGEHGIAIDLFDVVVADDSGRVPLPGGSGAELSLDARIGMTIVDLTGVYDRGADGKGLSFVYGTRIINQREDIDARIVTGGLPGPTVARDADDTLVDGLVGLRYDGSLAGHWRYQLTADVSTGGTDLTWSLSPAIGYDFGERGQYRLTAGYRYLAIDFDDAPAVATDMTLSGFLVGFRFGF
jgi:hypothetical protein